MSSVEGNVLQGDAGDEARIASGRQLGFLWGGVALALVALAPRARELAAALPACPFRAVTGVPCPACGSGSAALALAHLDFAGAFAASPLAALAWIGLVAGGIAAGIAAWRGRTVPGWSGPLPGRLRLAIVAAIALNWFYVILSR